MLAVTLEGENIIIEEELWIPVTDILNPDPE
jgi:hypothetical protein